MAGALGKRPKGQPVRWYQFGAAGALGAVWQAHDRKVTARVQTSTLGRLLSIAMVATCQNLTLHLQKTSDCNLRKPEVAP